MNDTGHDEFVELTRKDIDDVGRRNNNKDSYKNRHFDGKRTAVDEYSGETLYYSYKGKDTEGTKRHYTTKKTANVDHVVPIDKIMDKYADDIKSGKLTIEQVKDIANSDYNLAVTSEYRNKAKKGKSNIEYLREQFTIEKIKSGNVENINTTFKMIQTEVVAETASSYHANVDKIGNVVEEKLYIDPKNVKEFTGKSASAVASGAEAAFMSLTVSTVNNIVAIATEKKDVKQAAKDIVEDTGTSFISATGVDLLQYSLRSSAEKISNETVKNLLVKDLPIQQISAAVMAGNSIIRFINDEISAEDCVTEIVMNGLGTVAYSMGMALGGPAGAIVSTVVVGQINKLVLEYQKLNRLSKEKNRRITLLSNHALKEMEEQRNLFCNYVEQEYGIWDETIKSGFEKILSSSCEESFDLQGVTDGLEEILNLFDKHVAFKNIDEYRAQLNKPLVLSF